MLTQFRDDFFDADVAPLHQVFDSVKALAIGLLGFLEAGQQQIIVFKKYILYI